MMAAHQAQQIVRPTALRLSSAPSLQLLSWLQLTAPVFEISD